MEEFIWLEKYRPFKLDDIVGNETIVNKLKLLSREGNVLNMILTGPPGCGKTTSLLALCREILQDNFKLATIELNASDERGIDVVREKIKQFAERKINLPKGHHKVIILDESDSLTDSAQQALRMIISDYSDSTRFIFACNDSSKIIEPIQSRCAILRFSKLSDEDIEKALLKVAKSEHCVIEKKGIEALVVIADGDLRNAINNLQAVHMSRNRISEENVFEICDVPKIDQIESLFRKCAEGNLTESLKAFESIWEKQYCLDDLIHFLAKIVERIDKLDNRVKLRFIEKICELRFREAMGICSKIQIVGTIAELCEIGENFKLGKNVFY